MPQRLTIPFVGQEARDRSVAVDNQQTTNFITSIKGAGAKAPIVLETAPGLRFIDTAGNGPCRSPQMVQWFHPTTRTTALYGVFGDKFVQLRDGLAPIEIGTLATTEGRVRIERGRTHMMIVDGQRGYTYDGTTFQQITDDDFPDIDHDPVGAPTFVWYQDGFFMVNNANNDNWHISALEDPDSWNALDFEAANTSPDRALAGVSSNSIVYIIGDETTELYYNSGNPDFPFERILSGTQEVGTLAPQSVAVSDDGVFFLATTPEGGRFIYRIVGQQGAVITQDAQEYQLNEVSDIENAYGYIYKQAGKSFYVLQLGDDQPTLVYNIRTGQFESRSMSDGTAYRVAGVGVLNGKNIAGDRRSARYYQFDLNHYLDGDDPLVRRRVTQIYHINNSLMDWHELVIDVETGNANALPPGDDPQLRMRYSDDGGLTWSRQLFAAIGKRGATGGRASYFSLGQSRNRVFEIEFSDQINMTISNAYAYLAVLDD